MSELRLSFVGDIYAVPRTIERFRADPSMLDAAGALLGRADIRFANLEAPLLDEGRPLYSTGVRLRSQPALVEILQHLGIDVVNLANNHMGDFGPAGVAATCRVLAAAGLPAVGAGGDRAAAEGPIILTKNQQRVGFVAACDDEGGGAGKRRPGVALLAPRHLLGSVQQLRCLVDYVIVSLHTGLEFSTCPEPFFQDLARALIDAGAHLVIGHHPHVPQGIERYRGGLIAYSLGDFLFDLGRPPGDLSPREAAFNSVHTILEVDLAKGAIADHRVYWLGRDAAGGYLYPYAPAGVDLQREFEAMCDVLHDRRALSGAVNAIYRDFFKANLYHAPLLFLRHFRRGGSRALRRFLWGLANLRRQPKRRQLVHGGLGWCRQVAARLSGTEAPA